MNKLKTGYEVIFIAPQNRRHEGKLVTDRVIEEAEKLGLHRVTKRSDLEGTGHSGHTHAAHFFELADQPIELIYLLDDATADKLITAVDAAGIPVFCVQWQAAFGELGG
ncbi:hypothetical protein A11A3_01240 [Alcanivorax hongdengensis A-11-3]|uniref:Uncharacterized protein n=1 Tax=Alcanivorax hongdengensis A-11-3 TaxID=1177179 RepID=L0WGD2_9GAMM|nr:DUF190 domain-containing protein [Alcanivorax hongdengensis]EKF76076.1 hypothetical protein A11A3_01240 [Alcanivorax hongdengensis A-11-3]